MDFVDIERDPEQIRRFRQSILLFIILATLPCYCVGAILLGVAPSDDDETVENDQLPVQRTSTPREIATLDENITATSEPFRLPTSETTPTEFISINTSTPFQFIPRTRAPTPTQRPANRQPVFNQPGNVSLVEAETITVALDFSDPDNDPLTFEVYSSNTGIATVRKEGANTFTVTGVNAGTTSITVLLRDDRGGEVSRQLNATVREPQPTNRPPVFDQEPDNITLTAGEARNVTLDFSDPDGDTVNYTVVPSNNLVTISRVNSTTFRLTANSAGSTTLSITINDGNGGSANSIVDVMINPAPNSDPVFNTTPTTTASVDAGSSTQIPLSFSDPDGDTVTASASASNSNATASISGSTLTINGVTAGSSTVTITLNDGNGGETTHSIAVTINAVAANQNPVFNPAPPATASVDAGSSTTISLSFSDPDGDSVAASASASNANATASVAGTTLTINGVTAGSSTVTITLNDGNGGTATHSVAVTINAVVTNQNPVFTTPPPATLTLAQGDSSVVIVAFSDPDGDTVTMTTSSAPTGIVTTSPVNATSFTVLGSSAGTTTVTVQLSDGNGGTASRQIAVTVTAPVNQNPVFNSPPGSTTVSVSGTQTVNLNVSDPNGDTVTVSATSNNTGIATASVAGTSVTVNGIAEGSTTITITLSDGNGGSATGTLNVTVNP